MVEFRPKSLGTLLLPFNKNKDKEIMERSYKLDSNDTLATELD